MSNYPTITETNLTNELIDAVRIFADLAGNNELIAECERAKAEPNPTFGVHPVNAQARRLVVEALRALTHAAGPTEDE